MRLRHDGHTKKSTVTRLSPASAHSPKRRCQPPLIRIIDVEAGEMPHMVYVKPFDPLASYLFLKVRCEGGIDGSCMPLNSPTEQWRVDLFHAWIEGGAPPNRSGPRPQADRPEQGVDLPVLAKDRPV